MCGMTIGTPRDLPDAGEGGCCAGAGIYGKDYCTCWEPVYDLEQQPARPGPAEPRLTMCGDCAYRPTSPERTGDTTYMGSADFLAELVDTGDRFWCHQGMRRPVRWRHPSGAEIPGHPGDYSPPIVDGVPYQADGAPGLLCAGWHLQRAKAAQREGAIPRV